MELFLDLWINQILQTFCGFVIIIGPFKGFLVLSPTKLLQVLPILQSLRRYEEIWRSIYSRKWCQVVLTQERFCFFNSWLIFFEFLLHKVLWDEFSIVKPIPSCLRNLGYFCGALKTLININEKEYFVQFLIGLNDSFTHVQGHIMLMDPITSIDWVLSLILREE